MACTLRAAEMRLQTPSRAPPCPQKASCPQKAQCPQRAALPRAAGLSRACRRSAGLPCTQVSCSLLLPSQYTTTQSSTQLLLSQPQCTPLHASWTLDTLERGRGPSPSHILPKGALLLGRRGAQERGWAAHGTPREHQGGTSASAPPSHAPGSGAGGEGAANATAGEVQSASSRAGPPPPTSQTGNGAAVRGTDLRPGGSSATSNGTGPGSRSVTFTATNNSSSAGATKGGEGGEGRGGAEEAGQGNNRRGSWFQNPNNVLLFLALPVVALGATFLASLFIRQPRGYQATLRFPLACGVTVGTPVRVRGVAVGLVVALNPSLEGVDAVVEVRDEATGIPRRASIVANQSGLVGEPLIDITPEPPVAPHAHSPRDVEACRREGRILCAGDTARGETGVSVDELVGLWVRMGRKTEAERAKRAERAESRKSGSLQG